jgi:hypothetical protein
MWFLSALTWAPPQQKLIAAQLLTKRENENPRNRFYREKRRLPSKRCTGKPVKSRWEETTASQGVPPDPVSYRPAVEPTPQQAEQARQTHGQHRRRGRARAAGRARAPCQAAGGDEVELLRRRAKAALLRREARAGAAEAEPPPDLQVSASGALQPPAVSWLATCFARPTNRQLCAYALPCSSARRRAPAGRQATGCAPVTDIVTP